MIIKSSITKEEIAQMPREMFPGKIVVIQAESEVEKAVRFLETRPVVGIDTETRPSFRKGQSNQVALLQLSTDDICFLFRLNWIGIPDSIVRLLENPSVKKIGLSLKDDIRTLQHRTEFKQQACIELQEYVKAFGIMDNSLQKIYAILFGRKISKAQRLSNWEADVLSDAQQLYAATDAWTCYNIYNLLGTLLHTGDYELEKVVETVEQD